MSMQTISIMDYIGTFAFALSGAYLAIRYELDIFGIFVCAFSTACGGGITRDVVMNVGVPTDGRAPAGLPCFVERQ